MDSNGRRTTEISKYFQEDETNLLKYCIEKRYLPEIFSRPDNPEHWVEGLHFEFIVRPECNQHCEYCYITKYGNDLYPKEERVDIPTVLEHVKIIYNTFKRKKIFVPTIAYFAGEMVTEDLLFKLIELYYDYIKYARENGASVERFHGHARLEIPINTKSLLKPGVMEKYKEWADKFKELNTFISPSISTDGLYCTDTREAEFQMTQESYDKLFEFAEDVGCGFHPMIAPSNVEQWCTNLDWWVDMYKKYDRWQFYYPMLLHVRNDGWTDQKIEAYLKFLHHCWDLRFKSFDNDIERFTKCLFSILPEGIEEAKEPFKREGFDPLVIPTSSKTDNVGCGIQTSLYVNAANFKIVHCHRMTYPQFTAGYFNTDGEILTGVTADLGLGTWLSLQMEHPMLTVECVHCDYKYTCFKGCQGAQYEYSGEPLLPIPSVCNLHKAWIDELIKLYAESGVLKYALDNDFLKRDDIVAQFIFKVIKERGYNYVE